MAEELERYEILEEIGQGGFAIVYRAKDTELDRLVALKELRPTLLHDTEWVKGFKREARTIAHLDHPRIVTIFDVVEMEKRLFIAMRLVDGSSLDDLITTQGRLPWLQAVENITAVAEGLDYAHSQGILHRDLKPANILLDSKRGPLLSDFGMAKLVSEASTNVTAAGGIVGTPHYIAPEVWEGQGTTPQSDIYALGCILYEMLTGDKLFQGQSPPSVMMAHFNPLVFPSSWPKGVPSGLTDILEMALAKQPEDRYATAGDLAVALYRLAEGQLKTTSDVAISPRVASPTSAAPPTPRYPRLTHNLPAQTTPFIGREDELAEIKRLLLDEVDCRLLNLIGPGGTGKTRLALAVATQVLETFTDGAYFVALASVGEVEDIASAMAEALRFTFYGSAGPKAQLLDYLRQKQLLLVVDNFEHLLDGTDLLSDILSQAPAVTLLVTSRERLHLQEEWVYEVHGLAYPVVTGETSEISKTSEGLTSYSAIELFTQRARQITASFAPSQAEMADIGRICQLVEGMPLGLELAAPWIRTLSCREIAEEIERSLDFLTTTVRNVPARHRSLRVVFEQTWGRLSEAEQAVLQQLSVFRGGCTREAAEAVTGVALPVLLSLVDRALLRRTNTGRYELHELIRQFAEVQLQTDANVVEQAQKQHQDYFIAFLETRTAGVKGARQKETISEIKADIDNARLVWRRAVHNRDAEAIERAAECLFVFYLYSSGHYEGQTVFQQAAEAFIEGADSATDDDLPAELVIKDNQEHLAGFLLASQGYFLGRTVDPYMGQTRLEQALVLLRRAETRAPYKEGFALLWLGWMVYFQGKSAIDQEYIEPTLAVLNETGDHWALGWALLLRANALCDSRPLEAEEVYNIGLTVCRESGDQNNLGYTCQMRSGLNMDLGRYAQAKEYISEAIRAFEEMDNILGLGYALTRQGELATLLGEYQQAVQALQQARAHFSEARTEANIIWVQVDLGNALRLNGDHRQAEQLYQQSLEAATARNHMWHMTRCFQSLGCLAHDRGELRQAERFQREALALYQQLEQEARVADALRHLGHLMVTSGEPRHDEARDYFRQALELAIEHQVAPIALDVCVGVARLLTHAGEMERAVELLALAEQHEASTFETKEKARHHLAEWEDRLSSEAVQTGQTRGKAQDLWVTAEELLVHLGPT